MDFLPAPNAPPLFVMDYIGPAIGAVLFVLLMQAVPEPTRRTFNAVFVGGASGVYLSGGFGVWELVFPALVTPIVYRGLRSHRFIGLAWLLHAAWDFPHHLWGHPIWPFMPTSSFGCVVFDTLIAMWFLAEAPTLIRRTRRRLPALTSIMSTASKFTQDEDPAGSPAREVELERSRS